MGHIQVRNVPDDIHRKLKARAAEAGISLSEYLKREISTMVEKPTLADVVERIRSRELYDLDVDVAEIIKDEREQRDRELFDRARRLRER
jgi:antitoxin FitA